MLRSRQPTRPAVVLAVCCLSLLIVGVDNTIVTIGLPQIRGDLRASFAAAQWTVDAYQLVLGAFLLAAGAIADRWGRRSTLQLGLGVFTAASICCALAPSVGWLVAFRVVQALGGSMMNPVAMAIVSHAHPDPRRRAQAFGIWSGVYGLSMAIGPVLGGFLVEEAGWRSVFWVNVPFGVLAILLCGRLIPESKSAEPRAFDVVGQVLVVITLLAMVSAIIEGGALGWNSPPILGLVVVAVAAAAAFVRWEGCAREPMIDPAYFRSVPFSGAVVISIVGMGATAGYLWVMTFYLQDSRQLSPTAAGVALLPVAAMVLVSAPVSGRLAARRGARLPLVVSGAGIGISALVLTRLEVHTPSAVLVVSFVVFGVGFGMLNAPITNAAVAGMPKDRAAVASAVASTGRQVGQALGVAVIGAIVVPRIDSGAVVASLPVASRLGWWAIGVGGVLVAVIALGTTSRRAGSTAGSTREVESIGIR